MRDLELDDSTLEIISFNDTDYKKATNFKYTYDSETHLFVADLEQSFKKGMSYAFNVKYRGFLKNDNRGFYRGSYKDGGIEK